MASVKSGEFDITRRGFLAATGTAVSFLAWPGIAMSMAETSSHLSVEGLGRLYYVQVESPPLSQPAAGALRDYLLKGLVLGVEEGQSLLGRYGDDFLWSIRFEDGVRLDIASRAEGPGRSTRVTLRGERAVKSFTI